ncbi:hypothetical protein SKAU_G00317970 [Synaphobranchus kaupii]|uniref:BED-type domain-containing protein n=1 Tax=Synaphobranchus kaupii TaxID=118154 RepID=A0A9Q1ESY5_SYNKA|nr:hypothetical protein SKAU_G00317970 [Synaphobranchus kaupii]
MAATEAEDVVRQKAPAKHARHSSFVWKYFTEDNTNSTVECQLCMTILKYNKNTSAMLNHLKMKHPLSTASTSSNASTNEQRTTQRQTSINDFSKRPVTDKRRQQITDLLVNFVVKDIRPLSALSGGGFRDIINFFEPGYTIPSHATLWKTLTHQYSTVRANIAKEMKDKSVSLTTDLWTSCTMDPYITVTAHYITDSWELKSRVLRTTIMPERHTAVNIAQRLKETIEEWGLNVFCTIHDNASSMNLAMEICEQFPHHLGCTGHTLQLAIKAGLNLPEIARTTETARRVVSHFRHSSVAHCALKKRQEQLGIKVNKLQNDCATRWNSTFTMLERLNEQRIPVQAVLTDETATKLNIRRSLSMRESQWELIEQLIPVLRPLAKATTIMCAESHVGMSFIYPVLLNVADNTLRVRESDLAATRSFKDTVRKQLITRFKLESGGLADSIPITACMLDPRFKHLKFLPENTREDARMHLTQLVRQNRGEEQPGATGEHDAETGAEEDNAGLETEMQSGKKARLESDFEQLFGPHYESCSSKRKRSDNGADELRDYSLTPHIPTMENPLNWWAHNEHRFPRLAKLSKSYLAIPATSTPSERIFSLAGNTVTRQRSSLHPSHVDVLVFLNANQKDGREDFISEPDNDSE